MIRLMIGPVTATLTACLFGLAAAQAQDTLPDSPAAADSGAGILTGEGALEDGGPLIDAVLAEDTGGLAAIRARGYLRMAVAPDPLMIAYDGERALGVAIDIAQQLEEHLATLGDASGTPTVVVPTPTPRAEITTRIDGGRADFTTLTVTGPDRDEFSMTQPLIAEVNDVPVLGPGYGEIETLDDLVGLPIYVAEGGRYVANLERINAERIATGRDALTLKFVDPRLDDFDLIEMVEVGIIPATVASDFKARFWQTIYDSVVIEDDVPLTENGRIAWAVRSENPDLLAVLDGFAGEVKQGTLIGNIVLKRYAEDAAWIENLAASDARTRIAEVEPVIRKYAEAFGFESDLVLAQAYQESRLDQSRRSHVGAIGVMQVMPATAADPVVGIPDVTTLDSNVQAGLTYLHWLRETYFNDPTIEPLDRTLLAFAAYNAGPGGVNRARTRAEEMGLNPDIWFENVEVAIQRAVSREPAVYVRNIFKYYVSYRLLKDIEAERAETRQAIDDIADDLEALPPEDRAQALEDETGLVVGEAGPDVDPDRAVPRENIARD